jgi:hypothetical protein
VWGNYHAPIFRFSANLLLGQMASLSVVHFDYKTYSLLSAKLVFPISTSLKLKADFIDVSTAKTFILYHRLLLVTIEKTVEISTGNCCS